MTQRHDSRSHRLRGAAACLAASVLLLGACGEDTETDATSAEETTAEPSASVTPSDSPPESAEPTGPTESAAPVETEPQCSEVWVDGKPLPDSYKGCYEADTFVKADSQRCAFGAKLFVYDDRFYAAQFNQVNETQGLGEDAAFQRALNQCGG